VNSVSSTSNFTPTCGDCPLVDLKMPIGILRTVDGRVVNYVSVERIASTVLVIVTSVVNKLDRRRVMLTT